MEKLSVSLEDYIEEIYNQVLKNGQAKVTAIAEMLNVKKASVTGALNILSEKNLINYAPYSPITLTLEGEKIAKNIDCAFLLDEAYVEFFGKSAVNFVKKYPNLIVARTFSKAYGLAGARVGYMIAQEEVTKMIGKNFMPYHMNSLSLATADIVYQMRDEFVPRIQMAISERKRFSKKGIKI